MNTAPEPGLEALLERADYLKPLLSLQAAAGLLGLEWSEAHVRRAIEELAPRDPMRIEWAWNIATAGARQRDIRVLASCVPIQTRHVRQPFAAVLDEIFCDVVVSRGLQQYMTLSATFLARRFACTDQHIINLRRDGLLESTPASRNRTGRNSSEAITWGSVVNFLQTRRME